MTTFKSVATHGAGPPIQVPADSKPTPTLGPWCVPAGSGNEHVVCQGDDPHHPGRILFVLRHPMGTSNLIPEDEIGAAAQLAAEAGTVFHETGLTPQQLRADLNATKNVLGATREHVQRLEVERDELLKLLRRWNAIDAGSWAPDRHANEKRELIADTRAAISKVEGRS